MWSGPSRPGHMAASALADRRAAVQLHRVPLAVGEADGLHMRVAGERPGEAGRAVLAAGEQHQGVIVVHACNRSSVRGRRVTIS